MWSSSRSIVLALGLAFNALAAPTPGDITASLQISGPSLGLPGHNPHPIEHGWHHGNFSRLVVFGDSYSDDSRGAYIFEHGDQFPPAGWVNPPNPHSATGGYPWTEFAKRDLDIPLYNYAVAGAVCSNDITPRYLSFINEDFPAVAQYEVPAFFNDTAALDPATNSSFLPTDPDTTLYAIWIGTNDLGVNAFLTDSQVAGKTIPDYIDCVYDSLERVAKTTGARYFVILNAAPMDLAPMYALPSIGDNLYWPDKATAANATEVYGRMREQVAGVNALYAARTPLEALLKHRFPDAKFALFDVHSLMQNIYNNPSKYLNGTAPLNVTGYVNHCLLLCLQEPSPDSFMWYDELHPSEQTSRVIGAEFAKVARGESEYATYWG